MSILLVSVTAMVVLVGAALAFQAPINAVLAKGIGDPVLAAVLQFGIGFLALCAFALLRGSVPSLAALKSIPWWAFTGGALGALWVLVAIWSVSQLGLVTMFGAMILGQLIAAVLIDAGGVLGLQARDISPQRLIAISLVFLGVVLSYR